MINFQRLKSKQRNEYCIIEHMYHRNENPRAVAALYGGFVLPLKKPFNDVVGNDAADNSSDDVSDHIHAQSNEYFEHISHLPPQTLPPVEVRHWQNYIKIFHLYKEKWN